MQEDPQETSSLMPETSDKPSCLERVKRLFIRDVEDELDDEEEDLRGVVPIAFKELFRYSDARARMLFVIAIVCSCVDGALQSVQFYIAGRITTAYIEAHDPVGNTSFLNTLLIYAVILLLMSIVCSTTSAIELYLYQMASQRTTIAIKSEFVKSVLKQDATFYDSNTTGALLSQMDNNIERIENGLGDTFSSCVKTATRVMVAFVVSMTVQWRISIAMIVMFPVFMIADTLLGKLLQSPMLSLLELEQQAMNVAEESITNVRTLAACNGQETMIQRYTETSRRKIAFDAKFGLVDGLYAGVMASLKFLIRGVGMWCGVAGVQGGWIEHPGDAFAVVQALMYAATSLSSMSSYLINFVKVRMSAAVVYSTIDRKPSVVLDDLFGRELTDEDSSIAFEDIYFKYSSRDSAVLNGLSWHVKHGQTVALVGHSGCGKSTSVDLITRMLEADKGTVYIGSRPIQDYNTLKLRKMIGLVSQDSVIFDGTVRENIQLGRDVTDEEVEEAAKIANAHDFIMDLDEGYDTMLGASGVSLSGGQKQRISIARAIVTNPKILLLDEATSALDSHSERAVQVALEAACANRTTVVVAHRLSTIRNVDKIFVMDHGQVVEEGAYRELVDKENGVFAGMVRLQDSEEKEEIEKKRRRSSEMDASEEEEEEEEDEESSEEESEEDSEASFEETEYPSSKGGLLRVLSLERTRTIIMLTVAVITGVSEMFSSLLSFNAFRTIRSSAEMAEEMKNDTIGNVTEVEEGNPASSTMMSYVLVGILTWLTKQAYFYAANRASEEITLKLQLKVLNSVLHRPMAYFDRKGTSTSAVLSLFTKQPDIVWRAIDSSLTALFEGLTTIIFVTCICFYICPPNGLLCLFIAVSNAVLFNKFVKKSAEKNDEYSEAEATGQSSVEILSNARAIQLLSAEKFFLDRLTTKQKELDRIAKKIAFWDACEYGLNQMVQCATQGLSAGLGGFCLYGGWISVDQQFFSQEFLSTVGVSSSFMDCITAVRKADVAAKKLFALVDPSEAKNGLKRSIKGSLSADSITFAYPSRPDRTILDDVSFDVAQGKSLAFVGPSGSGKTTVAALALRLYDPDGGEMILDETPMSDIDLAHLRSYVALVSQEPILFNGSIMENVRLGCKDATDDDVRAACSLSNANAFIMEFPEGYDTEVGEKGRSLSGGQKQRIAIARALVKQPKVIVLDEATSALDSRSEQAVKEALEASAKGRTSIVIAHRLDTVNRCDEICYVEGGRIMERGNHKQLMKRNGKYAALVRAQKLI